MRVSLKINPSSSFYGGCRDSVQHVDKITETVKAFHPDIHILIPPSLLCSYHHALFAAHPHRQSRPSPTTLLGLQSFEDPELYIALDPLNIRIYVVCGFLSASQPTYEAWAGVWHTGRVFGRIFSYRKISNAIHLPR